MPVPVFTSAEAKAKAAYDAAEKAAQAADAAVVPLRGALQKADTAYAAASKVANAKRQQATDAKNLAGEPGVKELKQAEANVPDSTKALTDATNAKPIADQALADAKAAALPLRQAYDAAEKAAKEAAAVAWVAGVAANKLENEAKRAMAQAAARRRAADAAKAVLARLQQGQAQKKPADAAAENVKNQVAVATAALAAAEKVAKEFAKVAEEKKLAAAPGAAKRKAFTDAAAALAQALQAEEQASAQVNTVAPKLARATAQKKPADSALASIKKQIAAATPTAATAEKAAQDAAAKAQRISADAASSNADKKQASDAAAAKRKAANTAKAALAQARQGEPAAQTQATAAAQKLADAEAQKKAADMALASAKHQVAAAMAANQAARDAAPDLVQLDEANKQAAGKRKAADVAKAALTPVQQKLELAAMRATTAAQTLTQAEARKKSAEETLANLIKRIAAAKQTYLADEQAAQAAEAVAAPLKAEADKARAAYAAALKIADDRHALVQQAKGELYRLVAARQVGNLMESSNPPRPVNRIDEIVFAKLKTLGIQPVLCSDAVFVRRAYLDLTGKLPSAEDAKAFIQSQDQNKRAALIDRLLDQPAHVGYWAMKWSDILKVKAEFPVKVWPNAAQAYYRWVWESIAQNKPYDRFVRELLTSSGSNFRVGQVNFYRAIQDKTPEGIASAVGLALLGTRVQLWPADRRAGMAAFFSQVGYKPTSEWKEEIVFWDPLNSVAVPGSTAPGIDAVAKSVTVTNQIPQALDKPLSENGPLAAVFPDGAKITIPPTRDPREVFADWLIRPENPWFAKTIVNRTWAWVMGRGIIHEPDDIRPDNRPSNSELLAYLEKELVSSGYDLKRLKRLIFTSTTYQFSSVVRSKGPEARANFASYPLRRVEAEVLNDAVNEITGSTDLYTSAVPEPFSYMPKDMHAVDMADGSVTSSFLTLFGRSARATGMESERVNELASPQWRYMLNSGQMQNKLQTGPKLAALLSSGGKTPEIAERLYLTILSRFPTDSDIKSVEEYFKTRATKGREAWIDLAWALINSPEFLLRH